MLIVNYCLFTLINDRIMETFPPVLVVIVRWRQCKEGPGSRRVQRIGCLAKVTTLLAGLLSPYWTEVSAISFLPAAKFIFLNKKKLIFILKTFLLQQKIPPVTKPLSPQ